MTYPKNARARFSPAFFAGANLKALAIASSEKTFYDALGAVVFLISCISGCALWIAVSYAAQVPPHKIWWVAPLWALVILCIERLILQMPSKSGTWLIVGLLPRVLLSLLVAVAMEPLILLFNRSEISAYINTKVTNELRSAHSATAAYFVPKIEAAQQRIASIHRSERKLEDTVSHWRFLHACEAEVTTCSASHRLGRGPYWERDAREAATTESELRAIEPEDHRQIEQTHKEIHDLQETEKEQEEHRHAAITGGNGFSARFAALGAIEQKDPLIEAEVWFLRVFFVIVDLIPLTAKVWRMFAVKPAPYEEACTAARRQDSLDVKEREATNDVRSAGIDDRARADAEVNRARINLDAEREMNAAYEAAGYEPGASSPRDGHAASAISAWNLATFVDNMTPHETRPVAVPDALRRGGIVGLAAVAGLVVVMEVWKALFGELSGLWLAFACLAAFAALAAYTRGFRRAPAWALRAIFFALLFGLMLPILILVINI